MRKRTFLRGIFFVLGCTALLAKPKLDLQILPEFITPIGVTLPDSPELYKPGGGVRLGAYYSLPGLSWLLVGGDLGFHLAGTRETDSTLSMVGLQLAGGVSFPLSDTFGVQALIHGGYAIGLWNGLSDGQPSVEADVLFSWRLGPRFSLGIGAGYMNRINLYEGARILASSNISMGGGARDQFSPIEVQLDPVFPILYQYYDSNPFGSISLENSGSNALEDVSVTFFINTYMDSPKVCGTYDQVRRGEVVRTDLKALFNNQILKVTEGDRVAAEISVEYSSLDKSYSQTVTETLQIYNRNALTWDDDRKVAAFVTARDPNVLRYAKNSASVQEETSLQAINDNFRTAMVLFESLNTYGMSYIVDPKSSYKQMSEDALTLDFIQFPVQSLDYRSGDCDDLSILYNALLEAVGIETAFITIPGHIYSAFSLDMWPGDAEKTFDSLENLIVEDDTVWLPVEITALDKGFVKAWEIGAREWREATHNDQAAIMLTHSCWEVYQPVASPGDGTTLTQLPDRDRLLRVYAEGLDRFISRSIYAREQKLLKRVEAGDRLQAVNALGILYARYGLYDKAVAQFSQIAGRSAAAHTNLGNIAYIREEWRTALFHFEQAVSIQPQSKPALLGLAMACYRLNDFDASAEAYSKVSALDRELASRYSWLGDSLQSETGRASAADGGVRMLWEE
jgi:tetratricopeptide (TPR) repeat protein